MSLWSWLGLTPASSPPPPAPIEPAPPSVTRATKQGGLDDLNSGAWAHPMMFAALGGMPSNTGVPVTMLTSLQAAAVYGCVKCIAEDIAGLKLQIRRRLPNGGWLALPDHPLVRLFRRPNRWQCAFQFWSYVLTCFCLRGNSYVVVLRDWAGAPRALVPVHPDQVSIELDPTTGIILYRTNSVFLGPGRVFFADDVLHLKNMSIDGIIGVSPIACAQDVIGLALAAQQHGAILFRQGAQVGGVLSHPGQLSTEAKDNIAASWRDNYAGVQNAHKIPILEEDMKYEKITMTNEDAQFLATRQFQVTDICRIFRVPPQKLGELGRATYGNIENQQRAYIDDCLHSHTDQLEGLMDDQLLFDDERDDHETHWDYTSMLQGDQTTRWGAYQIGLLNGFLSINEARARENMNPIPGGDEYRVPLNTDPLHPETMGQVKPPSTTEDDDGMGDDDTV